MERRVNHKKRDRIKKEAEMIALEVAAKKIHDYLKNDFDSDHQKNVHYEMIKRELTNIKWKLINKSFRL